MEMIGYHAKRDRDEALILTVTVFPSLPFSLSSRRPFTFLVVADAKELVHSLILFDEDEIVCCHSFLRGRCLCTDGKKTQMGLDQPKATTLTRFLPWLQQNPLIPKDISTSCATYMAALDSDPQILSCTKIFSNAISTFGPGNTLNASSSSINTVLNSFCSSLSTCSGSVIRNQLTEFYANCPAELTSSSPNANVFRAYDVLYSLVPFSQAVCAKGDDGGYCVLEIASTLKAGKNLLASSGSDPTSDLWSTVTKNSRRDEQVIVPNLQEFKAQNLALLGLQPSDGQQQLCQSCTRNVLNPHLQFSSSLPYALGLSNSLILGGVIDLYNAVQSKCGSPFLSGSVQAAGGISNGVINGAADLSVNPRTVAGAFSAVVAGFFITL